MAYMIQFCFEQLPWWGFCLVLLATLLLTLRTGIAATVAVAASVFDEWNTAPPLWLSIVALFGGFGLASATGAALWIWQYFLGFLIIGLRFVGLVLVLPFRLLWLGLLLATQKLRDWLLIQVWLLLIIHNPDFVESEVNRPSPAVVGKYDEACQILGLSGDFSRAQLRAKYTALQQSMHGDAGGSDWIAARVNAARDVINKKKGWVK